MTARCRATNLLAGVLILSLSPVLDGHAQVPGIDAVSAAQQFEELRALCEAEGGALWGVSLCGSTLLVEPATRQVAADRADEEGALREEGGVYTGTLPGDVPVTNTAIRWAGVHWAMLMWPLPADEFDRLALLAHRRPAQQRLGPAHGSGAGGPGGATARRRRLEPGAGRGLDRPGG